MKTMRLQSSLYATALYIILCLEPTSSAQLRPRGLAATNTHAAGPDSEWSESSRAMSLATTTSMNFIEANDKGAKVRAQGLSAKAGKSTKGGNICPASEGLCADVCLEALSDESTDCPTVAVTRKCDNEETAIGELCKGNGACGTDRDLNNCGNHGYDDIYRRIECKSGKSGKHGKSSKASGNPAGNPGATCANVCLQALPENSDNCPENLALPNCYSELTDIGEYCDGDGECGTDDNLDNCSGYDDDGDGESDVYIRVDCNCLIVN